MIFDQMTGALYADDGAFLKTVHCPLALRPEQLVQSSNGASDRFCNSCQKTIRCIDDLTDSDVQAALSEDESLCVFSTPKAKNIVFLRPTGATQNNYAGLPVVRTMRSLEAMADAQARGFDLILESTNENSEFGEDKYLVYQNKSTGKLWWSGDYRNAGPTSEKPWSPDASEWELIRDWFYARSDRPFPLAAYAVPKDLPIGSRVFLEDLIKDVLMSVWNQGNAKRVISSNAIWDGAKFEVEEPMGLGVVG